MSEHTKEPWHIVPHPEFWSADARIDADSEAAWGSFGQIAYATPANARRIVACVNACAGIGTEWLKKNANMLQSLVEDIQNVSCQLDDAMAQRDELLAAAKRLSSERTMGLASLESWNILRAAIANAEARPGARCIQGRLLR